MIYEDFNQFSSKIEQNKPIIGLDYGNSRIGIAISDPNHIIASPLETYQKRNNSKDLGHINKIALDNNACSYILGLPLELDGNNSELCDQIRNFAAKLVKKSNIAVFLQDERMSTSAVTRSLNQSNMSRTKQQSKDDMLAASYILQIVLDRI